MSEHEVESLLGELRPAGLPAQADAEILAAIRSAKGESGAVPVSKSTPVYRQSVPAWAAAAACLFASAVSWMAGAGSASTTRPTRVAEDERLMHQPAVPRVHVESNVFADSPPRDLDISKWTPVTGHNRENRS